MKDPYSRFETVDSNKEFVNAASVIREIVDNKTGVHYLCIVMDNNGVSLTPMIGEDGKIVIEKRRNEK